MDKQIFIVDKICITVRLYDGTGIWIKRAVKATSSSVWWGIEIKMAHPRGIWNAWMVKLVFRLLLSGYEVKLLRNCEYLFVYGMEDVG